MNLSRHKLDAVCFAAAITVGSIALGMHILVPEAVADYVSSGFILPSFRYGLLLPLIACGLILSGERPISLVAGFAVLASTLWLGLHWAETIFAADEELALLILRYPVLATAMGLTAGSTLLLPLPARRWLVPVVCASCGLGLGLSMVLESPGDDYSGWFTWAGGLGGMAVIIASLALTGGVRRLGAGPGLTVAGRIFGSWLMAASLMLLVLTIARERPLESAPAPSTISSSINVSR